MTQLRGTSHGYPDHSLIESGSLDRSTKPFRIAVVNSHPIQYFAPMYAYLNGDPGLEVTALYCSDVSLRGGVDAGFKQVVSWDVDLLGGYSVRWLGTRARRRTPRGFWSLVCPEVWWELGRSRYDAVLIHGYGYAAHVLAFLAAKWYGLHVFVRSETHLGLKRPRWRQAVRDTVLAVAYRFVDAFLAIGSLNRAYYRSLGIADKKIFDVPYTVDNARFAAAASLSDQERAEYRKKLGLPSGKPVVLYASKFMRRKHPDSLVRAMGMLQERGVHASLLFVGSGEMELELRELVEINDLYGVVFAGFANQSEMPRIFAVSDVFVLPAENEPWGLIVNEAMCAGLPVIVGEGVGCAPDLVRSGETGYTTKAGDDRALADALHRLLAEPEMCREMGQRAKDAISKWNYERCRIGVRAAVAFCSG